MGSYDCTWAMWTLTPNLLDGTNAVTDTAVFVDDGTAADSLGCSALLNAAAVNGKIAVAYRGDCEFGAKAINAQNAGAVALVVINNVPGPLTAMGEGTLGSGVTIPVVLVSDLTGAMLHSEILAGNVELFIGPPCMLSSTCEDLQTFLGTMCHVPGFPTYYWVGAHNVDWVNDFNNVVMELTYDPSLTLVSTSLPPAISTSGYLQWQIPVIYTLDTRVIEVEFAVPASAVLGTVVSAQATSTPMAPDDDPANDSYSTSVIITGAYDPNDKQVQTSSLASSSEYLLGVDEFVDYTIRFQNTGTAAATAVYLLDTVSSLFQHDVPEVLGSSHPCTAHWLPDGVLRFDFPGIILPDSVSDPAGSHGFVNFRLRPEAGLALGTTLANTADIFFDFNPPIRTNTSLLVVSEPAGISEPALQPISVFPDPTEGPLEILLPAHGRFDPLVLRSAAGVEVLRAKIPSNATSLTIDASSLASGIYLVEASGGAGRSTVRFLKH